MLRKRRAVERQYLPTNEVDESEFLTVNEVAAALAVCRKTVCDLMDKGQLAYVTIGSRKRIPRKSLVDLANGAVTSKR